MSKDYNGVSIVNFLEAQLKDIESLMLLPFYNEKIEKGWESREVLTLSYVIRKVQRYNTYANN